MESIRKYGKPPFFVALLHGGPGAPGEMAPVARVLAWHGGVLEPLQRAASLTGQVAELSAVLRRQAALPVILVGFSWGALLGFMVAAREPALVKKLVLIGSAPFRACDAAAIPRERMGRLSAHEQAQARLLLEVFRNARGKKARIAFARLGELCSRADAYDPIACDAEVISYQAEVFRRLWPQVEAFRASGRLLELARRIRCPVVAMHGDYDPHPAEGVRQPLADTLDDFRFILLPRCGHKPWIERQARQRFFELLREEVWGRRPAGKLLP